MVEQTRGPRSGAGPAAGERHRQVTLRRSLAYFVPSYLVAIVGYLAINAIAARVLGPSTFAYYVVLLTATTLVGQLGLLGVHRSGLREASRAESQSELEELLRGVRAVLRMPLPVVSLGCALVVWGWWGFSAGSVLVAVLSGLLVYESGYQLVAVNYLRGLGHLRLASMLSGRSGGALVAATQTVCVGLVAWLAPGTGLDGILLGTVVGYALPLAWAGRVLRTSPRGRGRPTVGWGDVRRVLRRDWKFTVSQSGGFLNSTVELWLAAALLAPVTASLFIAAQRLARLLIIPATSLQIVFSPAIARLSGRGRYRELESLVRTAATVATVVSAVLWLPMVVRPGFVLDTVFGAGFAAAGATLALIATGYLLNGVSGMSGTTLSMSHHEGDTAVITWCIVGVRVLLGTVSVSLWGVLGLAASSALISVVFYIATWTAVRRRLDISTHATIRPHLGLLTRIRG